MFLPPTYSRQLFELAAHRHAVGRQDVAEEGKRVARNATSSACKISVDDAAARGAFLDVAGQGGGGVFVFAQRAQLRAFFEVACFDQKQAIRRGHVLEQRGQRSRHAVGRLLQPHQTPPAAERLGRHFVMQPRGIVRDRGCREACGAERIVDIGNGFFRDDVGALSRTRPASGP